MKTKSRHAATKAITARAMQATIRMLRHEVDSLDKKCGERETALKGAIEQNQQLLLTNKDIGARLESANRNHLVTREQLNAANNELDKARKIIVQLTARELSL